MDATLWLMTDTIQRLARIAANVPPTTLVCIELGGPALGHAQSLSVKVERREWSCVGPNISAVVEHILDRLEAHITASPQRQGQAPTTRPSPPSSALLIIQSVIVPHQGVHAVR